MSTLQISKPATEPKTQSMSFVSWLFLIGSIILFGDETLSLIEGVSLHTVLEFLASLFFVIGSFAFVTQEAQQD